ncbi:MULTISPECIES: hypothetical protein [Roseomonas]|uniref:hypothetical protein n=1 Tax=Roseomonas TaxID=125216 RepID=UPI0004B001FE|nr:MULTISPECIES: hypothetical protein [Roseomonas]MDT8274897.1 hypothetical protein [Roseomonas mucosa]SUE43067.1 Uncharacterised protein [Roseomonas gilardii subsp. rosea]
MSAGKIWNVIHYRAQAEDDERADPKLELSAKLIGNFSTRAKAEDAVARRMPWAGFRDWPGGFRITEITLDQDLWPNGFPETD